MKEIYISQNKIVFVDDEDYDYENQFKWTCRKSNKTYYATRQRRKEYYRYNIHMHRTILQRKLDRILNSDEQVDHIDLNGLNNQRYNLRVATVSQNQANCTYNHTSSFKGVYYDSKRKLYRSRIKIMYKEILLGYYSTAEEAAKAYNKAAIKHFKEFARLNDV